MFIILELLHPKCNVCLYFGKFNINHINVILSVFLQINLVYVRLFTETCKQTESSYKRYHIHHTLESGIDVGQGINVGPGKFVKKNKRRALNKRRA